MVTSADLLVRMLGACELRARVVSANIANSNTPGYVRSVVRFEELLRKELLEGGDPARVELTAACLPDALQLLAIASVPDDRFVRYPATYKLGDHPEVD